jgi:hypothetical protein
VRRYLNARSGKVLLNRASPTNNSWRPTLNPVLG